MLVKVVFWFGLEFDFIGKALLQPEQLYALVCNSSELLTSRYRLMTSVVIVKLGFLSELVGKCTRTPHRCLWESTSPKGRPIVLQKPSEGKTVFST